MSPEERARKFAETRLSERGWHPAARNAGIIIAAEIRARAEHLAKANLKRPELHAYRDGLRDMAEDTARAISRT